MTTRPIKDYSDLLLKKDFTTIASFFTQDASVHLINTSELLSVLDYIEKIKELFCSACVTLERLNHYETIDKTYKAITIFTITYKDGSKQNKKIVSFYQLKQEGDLLLIESIDDYWFSIF